MIELGKQITDDEIVQLAQLFGIEWACVKMIMDVESKNEGFYKGTTEPVVLFEGRWFHKLTGGKFDAKYPSLSFPINNAVTRKYYDLNQVDQVQKAYALAPDAALQSASWGMMQVMGFNYKLLGYASVVTFVRDMYESEFNQLRAGLLYIKNAGLIPAIKAKNFDAIRRGYNGDTEIDTYDYAGKLKRAYEHWKVVQLTMGI